MGQLQPGDIVVYEHTANGDPNFNGSVGVVKSYLSDIDYLEVTWVMERSGRRPNPHPWNVRKIGHLDDF